MLPRNFQQIGRWSWTNGRYTITVTRNGTGLRIEQERCDCAESGELIHFGSSVIYDGDLPPEGLVATLYDPTIIACPRLRGHALPGTDPVSIRVARDVAVFLSDPETPPAVHSEWGEYQQPSRIRW